MRPSPLSVSELNEYVRRSLAGDPMLQGLGLRGEISNFKRHSSGHLYFTLKDDSSRIACVMFRQHAQQLRFAPSDGMQVLLSGSVGLYTASGSYQFYGEAMVQDGTGALYALFLKTKERLTQEGLFDVSLKKPLPLLPRAVGVVTSGGGAVLHDIVTVAGRRFPGLPIILRAAQVQGSGAAEDLARGLAELAALPQVEVIIIGRGGGSLEDLWAFNEEVLVRAVAACPKPVISAVGHETDVTLCDFAADVRAATPSAAAELAVPQKSDLMVQLLAFQNRLDSLAAQNLHQTQSRLQLLETRLKACSPDKRLAVMQLELSALVQRLQAGLETRFDALKHQAQRAILQFELKSPQNTLKRGYVIALSQGQPVSSVTQVGDRLSLQFVDGQAEVQTISTTKEKLM